MRKLLILLIVFFFGCTKEWGKKCWDCDVTRLNGTKYYEKVCNEGEYPKFKDRQGNSLNSFCSER